MRPFLQLAGVAFVGGGIVHLLFPKQLHFALAEAAQGLPLGIGQQVELWFPRVPVTAWRVEGLGWIAAGAFLLWQAGPAETT